MDPLERTLLAAGGIATSSELARLGVDARRLRLAVASGAVSRVRRGVYALPAAAPARVAAVRVGGRLAGLSATGSYGLWDGWDSRLHVVVPSNAALVPPRAGRGARRIDGFEVVVHWGDDRRDGCLWRESPGRALRHVLQWHDWETSAACIEGALTAGLLTVDQLPRLARSAPPGVTSDVLALRPGAQSGLETIVRIRLEALGFAVARQQAVSKVGHIDLAILGTRVLVEIDGYEYHSTRSAFAEDRRRDAESGAQGLVTLRFTAGHVRDDWDWMAHMIVETVGAFSAGVGLN